MIEYELNDAYRKLINTVDREFDEDVFSSVSKKLNGMFDKIKEQVDYCIRFDRISPDFNIRQRDIEDIIENSKYSYKKIIAKYKEEVVEACKNLYTAMQEIIRTSATNDEKNKLIARYIDEYKFSISSIHKKSQNYSIELYDDLDVYFRRNSGNDDIYYEMKDFLKRDKEKFVEFYSETIKSVLVIANKKLVADLENIVLPHLNKEEKVEEEKKEQIEKEAPIQNQVPNVITNTETKENVASNQEKVSKYSFKQDAKMFVNTVKIIIKKDIPEWMERQLASELDHILYPNYAKVDQMGMEIALKIQQLRKTDRNNYVNDSYQLLEDYYIFYDNFKKQEYDNNLFNSFLFDTLHINVENLNQQEREVLTNLINQYKKNFNAFLFSKIDEIYYKNTNYIKNNFGVEYLVQNDNELVQNKGNKI